MLIVMKPSATASEIDAVVNVIEAVGFRAHPMPGATRTAIGITGMDGGEMAREGLLDHCLVVETDSIHRIQETHAALCVALWSTVQEHMLNTAARHG